MKDLIFAKNINGTDEAGIINVKTMELLCLCTKENSELILRAFEIRDSYIELEDKIAKFYEDDEINGSEFNEVGDLCDIGEVAAMHFGFYKNINK